MKVVSYNVERFTRAIRFRYTRRLPKRQPKDVWDGIESVTISLRPFVGRVQNVSQYELIVLSSVVKYMGATRLFEFGTFDGFTTWHLAANAAPTAKIWTLDLPLNHPARLCRVSHRSVGRIHGCVVGEKFLESAEAKKIEQVYCDSLTFEVGRYQNQMDFCFIDAGHMYENVCRDTASALAMTRPGGIIFWHDYSCWWPGVQRCLDELSLRLPVFQVHGTALAAVQIPV